MTLRSLTTCLLVCLSASACVRAENTGPTSAPDKAGERRNANLLLERARAFARMGDSTRAEQYLNAALEHGADDREVFPLLLEVCVRDNRYWSAVSYAEYYLRKRPDDYRMRFVLATLYIGLEDVARARTQFEAVLEAKPEHAPAHYAFAVLLRDNIGDFSAADHHFREYLRVAPKGAHADEANASLLNQVP